MAAEEVMSDIEILMKRGWTECMSQPLPWQPYCSRENSEIGIRVTVGPRFRESQKPQRPIPRRFPGSAVLATTAPTDL